MYTFKKYAFLKCFDKHMLLNTQICQMPPLELDGTICFVNKVLNVHMLFMTVTCKITIDRIACTKFTNAHHE